jgi:hypothetical protein
MMGDIGEKSQTSFEKLWRLGIGFNANVSAGNLTNATAMGNSAIVNASNKIRLGDGSVNMIEGAVMFTAGSDKTKKENFQPVDGEEVLGKIRGFELSSWNFIGHDLKEFRHYGPMAQDSANQQRLITVQRWSAFKVTISSVSTSIQRLCTKLQEGKALG